MAEIEGDDSRSAAKSAVSEPTTEAGRYLVDRLDTVEAGPGFRDPGAFIVAIEAEARRDALRQAREAVAAHIADGAYRCPDCKATEGPCIDEQHVLAAIDALIGS